MTSSSVIAVDHNSAGTVLLRNLSACSPSDHKGCSGQGRKLSTSSPRRRELLSMFGPYCQFYGQGDNSVTGVPRSRILSAGFVMKHVVGQFPKLAPHLCTPVQRGVSMYARLCAKCCMRTRCQLELWTVFRRSLIECVHNRPNLLYLLQDDCAFVFLRHPIREY